MSRRPNVVARPSLPLERAAEIRAQLERVLSSPQFRGSRHCQSLLRHITEQTLAGDVGSLKERTLGVEVFGRPADYDTSQHPVVRATAAEIRKKLAQYYQDSGHESEPRIELLSGSYVAEFHLNGAAAPLAEQRWRRYALIGGGIALPLVAVVIFAFASVRSDLDRLWTPLLKAPGPVLICVGQPIAYNLKSAQAQDAIQGIGAQQPLPGSNEEAIPKKELVILWDRYVSLGDAVCLVHLTSLFQKYGKPYHIRGERSTSFADLREGPAVLIAAFDNQWTLHAAGQLRFTFVKDSASEIDMVQDRLHPENTQWRLTKAWPHWDVPNDYAIVSRVLDGATDRPMVIAAGITQYGTMAAGDFLSSPAYFSEAVRQLPSGWQKKNLQIVLSVPVVNHVPGHPRILATHVW